MNPRSNEPPVLEDDFSEEPTIKAPTSSGRKFNMNLGGGTGKTLIISVVVTLVVLGLMSVVGKGGLFVNKSDFTSNMANVVTALDGTAKIATKAQTDVATAIQSIPETVSNQVDTKVSQQVSQINTKITELNQKITEANSSSQAASTKVNELTTKLNSDIASLTARFNTETTSLTAKNTELATKLANLETTIKSLETRLIAIENQAVAASVVVNENVAQYGIMNGVAVYVPLSVTNSGSTDVVVPVKLVLTTASSNITVSSATMSGTYTVVVSGSMVTFTTTVSVPTNSSISFNGIWVKLVYSGISPNTWSAQWSKE